MPRKYLPTRPDLRRFDQRRMFSASAKMISLYKELSFLEQIELCRIWAMASMVWAGVTAPDQADQFLDMLRARTHEDLSEWANTDVRLRHDIRPVNPPGQRGNGKA